MIDPTEFFREIVGSITDEETLKIASIMLRHIGEEHLIELKELAVQAFGEFNPATERKTRLILAELVEKHKLPVGAYSGKSGRWLCVDEEEKERVIQDLEARHNSLQDRIRNIRMARTPPKAIEPGRAYQRNLWQ